MKKFLAVLLVLLGLGTMLYPKGMQIYSSYKQEKLFQEWEQQQQVGNSELEESYKTLEKAFSKDNDSQSHSETSVQQKSDENQQQGMIGTIEIKKIDLKLPILEGADLKNLEIAAGHLEGTAPLGQVGNSAIAAHRSRAFGKMFNRLNEIQVGDEIKVQDKQNHYTYQVYDILIVNPDNLSVLESQGSHKILTLITCDPIDTGTHRLIIHAKLETN